jgi:3-phosphoglycerate kinase
MDTVVWTGALGCVEDETCATGTLTVARALPSGTGRRVVLGGDALVAALAAAGLGEVGELTSATDSLLELFKTGDLAALAALRQTRPPAR